MIKRKDPMSSEGLNHWSPKNRNRIYRYVYRCLGSIEMPYDVCRTRRDFAEWIRQEFGNGYFYVFSWKKGYYKDKKKSKRWLIPHKIAEINLPEGRPPVFVDIKKISKFSWFEPRDERHR